MAAVCSELAGRLACILVLFNPLAGVAETVRRLAARYPVILVVNAAGMEFIAQFEGLDGLFVLRNPGNIGLAAALNRGVAFAFGELGVSFVTLFDQDSNPDVSMPENLLKELLERRGQVACIGPRLFDKKEVSAHYATNDASASRCRSIPTSGSVIPKSVFEEVGPMMESLFIDGIDHEWCFRACHKGYEVRVSERTSMVHDMGDSGLNYFGRYKPVHRSPIRHYYIVRNTLALSRLDYLPLGWRALELMKTVRRIVAYLIFSSNRRLTLRLLAWAILDGLRGHLGPCRHLNTKENS